MEISFTLGSFRFYRDVTPKNEKKTKKEKHGKDNFRNYRELFEKYYELLTHSEVLIRNITLPCVSRGDIASDVTRPWKYYGVIYSLLTFLRANSKRLVVNDNAIILNSDSDRLTLDILFKVRLFRIIGTLAVFIFTKKIIKKKAA